MTPGIGTQYATGLSGRANEAANLSHGLASGRLHVTQAAALAGG